MNILKYALFAFTLVIVFSISAQAQETEHDKKIPKTNAPVVIVGKEKKPDDKPKDNRSSEDKRGNKPQSYN